MTTRRIVVMLAIASLPVTAATSDREAPAWFLEEIAMLTAGDGRWTADNSEYRSADEPYDAYVTEWRASFGATTLSGRLFGLKNGEQSTDFWEFRQYWDPEAREAVVLQFGWGGRVGIGTAWQQDGRTHSLQTFSAPDGSPHQAGHISWFEDDVTHVTESFDVVDGAWQPRRRYEWRRSLRLSE
ncbi:MAG: hypothetical protein R3288_11780 [Woeseiaceae bacterium]|nr:hypothetical protein [Woeseiaceae bacterium]